MIEKKISVEKAIDFGKKRVHNPSYIFLFSGFLVTFSLTTNLFTKKGILPVEYIPVGFLLTIVLTVFVSNKLISKWKLWAFENVRNVHELKRRAIQERLLYHNSSFMEKMEFKSSKERKQWKEILLKFEQEDVLTENLKIAKETKIYYSIKKTLFKSFCYLIMTCFFILLAFDNEFSIITVIFTLGGFYLFFSKIRKLFNREPQLTINEKGIRQKSSEIMKWKNINNEQIIANSNTSSLFFTFRNEENLIDIKDFDITKNNLKELIETNRIRNKNYSQQSV